MGFGFFGSNNAANGFTLHNMDSAGLGLKAPADTPSITAPEGGLGLSAKGTQAGSTAKSRKETGLGKETPGIESLPSIPSAPPRKRITQAQIEPLPELDPGLFEAPGGGTNKFTQAEVITPEQFFQA